MHLLVKGILKCYFVMSAILRSLHGDVITRVSFPYTWFVQKVSGLTTVYEVVKAYGVLTLIVFNIVPLHSYTLRSTFLPLLETFCKLLFPDV